VPYGASLGVSGSVGGGGRLIKVGALEVIVWLSAIQNPSKSLGRAISRGLTVQDVVTGVKRGAGLLVRHDVGRPQRKQGQSRAQAIAPHTSTAEQPHKQSAIPTSIQLPVSSK
jgi:hypothetical protein